MTDAQFAMPGMIQRAHGMRTTNTRPPSPPAPKPARAKAHTSQPVYQGDDFVFRTLTVAGGEKGTGVRLSRHGYFLNRTTKELQSRSRIPIAAATIRQRLEDIALAAGYTIVHWPPELRP